MSVTTAGIDVRAGSRRWRDAVELVSSMRFSISLLTVICIASVIGTVVKQHEPFTNYVNQFGPFWADVFRRLDLYTVYGAWWFLLILAFLVLSTSLCVARNAPKILSDLRNYKEQLREQSLQAFHLRAQADLPDAPEAALQRAAETLATLGWKAKLQQRRDDAGNVRGTMIAARQGASNKLGYIAAHSAIVLICLGGLFDGDLVVKAQMALQGKSVFTGNGLFRDVGRAHRLGPATPSFRANLSVAEGAHSGTAVIAMQDGVVLQELPFDVELKKFIVEYYETGMPRLFASEIVIHDHENGQAVAATVKVNEPAVHRGVAIYQSSFDDGGSKVRLHALAMRPDATDFDVEGVIGETTPLRPQQVAGAGPLTLEFTGLRVINVENLAGQGATSTDVRSVDLATTLDRHLGSGAKGDTRKSLHNVGPSISYKLRDASGQAREFNNYMLPVELDGQRVFLAGTRDTPGQPFRYLRIPADDGASLNGWARLRRALQDPAQRERAARRYAQSATPAGKPEMTPQLATTAQRTLSMFAGAEAAKPGTAPTGGLGAISAFLEDSVPGPERQHVADVLLRILNGSLFELLNETRVAAGQQPLDPQAASTQNFMTQAVLSLADSFFYPAPVLLALADFQQVQASVFQVTRAPGQKLVYFGAALLIVGVFAMLYIRERRLWIWLAPQDTGSGTRITMALSSTRHTLDAEREFEHLKRTILKG